MVYNFDKRSSFVFSLSTWALLFRACLVFPTPGFLPPLPPLCFFMLNGLVSLCSDPANTNHNKWLSARTYASMHGGYNNNLCNRIAKN